MLIVIQWMKGWMQQHVVHTTPALSMRNELFVCMLIVIQWMKGWMQQHVVHTTPALSMLLAQSSDRMVSVASTKESLLISGVQEHLGDFIFWRT